MCLTFFCCTHVSWYSCSFASCLQCWPTCIFLQKTCFCFKMWCATMRHVAHLSNRNDLTCRSCPTLLPFALSLSSLSLFLSPPPSPAPVLHKPEHKTQLKTLCPKATYSEPQDRLRDFRDCLWVLQTIRYLSHAAYLSLHRWTHIFLKRLSRLPAGFLYIHEVILYCLSPFTASCYLIYYFLCNI